MGDIIHAGRRSNEKEPKKTKEMPKLSFNGFVMDLDRACLLHAGQEVKLRPKVFETLRYLVENRNRLVAKDELIKAVWADAFVTDDSLVQCLVELRRALGDKAQGCVKTVPKRGYIFIADVKQVRAEEIFRRRSSGTALIAFMTVAGAALAIFLYSRLARTPPSQLSDRDTILVADFVNTTSDGVFDGTLKQALAVQLGQAPFLNIFPEERIRETLRYMDRPPDTPVTREIAREIAQRQGIKALLAGTISTLAGRYVINLEAVNAETGDTIAREDTEADSREQVLSRLGDAASNLREKLGESLSSIDRYDTPIEQATTSSLEALKAFSFGRERHFSGKYFEAIPFYRRAIDLDPNFAIAYAALAVTYGSAQEHGLAAQFSEEAFRLRERTSEREKFYISARYYMDVWGDVDKTIEVQQLWKHTYPRDFVPRTNLSARFSSIGRYEEALEEALEGIRLNPDAGVGYASLAVSYLSLGRYHDAKRAIQQALARKLQPPHYRYMLYSIAFLEGDTPAMAEQVAGTVGTPAEAGMLAKQSAIAGYSGQLRRASDLTRRAIDLAIRRGFKESASQFSAGDALWEALFGECGEANETASRSLAITRGRQALSWSALALALCGESNEAGLLMDEMSSRFPNDSFFRMFWLPMIRSAVEIHHDNPSQAVELLEPASRGEIGTNPALWPAYIRGLAYLNERTPQEAIGEFQKILDHKGVLAPQELNPVAICLVPAAHLWLARANAAAGDTKKSRKAYEDLFAIWKDADPDIPSLAAAKREYQHLK